LVLAYAVSQNVILAGLAAMLALSLGMGLTTSGFALAAIGSRGALLTVMQQRGRLLELTTLALSLGGALAMAALGALLFAGRLA
jgi:ABC-type nickel/cobalt efflux system permease component RcnA